MPRYDDEAEDERPRSRRQRDRDEFDEDEERPRRRSRRDEVDEDEERPSRRRSRYDEDDEDDRPRRRSRRRESGDNPAAGISLTLGLLSILLNVITGIPAIVFGIIGFQKAGKNGNGKGMALAGIGSAIVCSAISGYGIYFFWSMKSERQADNRTFNSVKHIGMAFHNYHDANNRFPDAYSLPPHLFLGNQVAQPEQRLNSWRTHLLPYIEQDNLFRQYDSSQPWNSARNQMVSNTVVPDYADGDRKTNNTRYRVFTGPNTPFKHGIAGRIVAITDGTSNTILMAESADLGPWAEPKDMEVTPGNPLPQLGDPAKRDFLILMADGSVRTTRKSLPENVLRLLIDPSDGQVVPFDW